MFRLIFTPVRWGKIICLTEGWQLNSEAAEKNWTKIRESFQGISENFMHLRFLKLKKTAKIPHFCKQNIFVGNQGKSLKSLF